jgi:hypothetical protein
LGCCSAKGLQYQLYQVCGQKNFIDSNIWVILTTRKTLWIQFHIFKLLLGLAEITSDHSKMGIHSRHKTQGQAQIYKVSQKKAFNSQSPLGEAEYCHHSTAVPENETIEIPGKRLRRDAEMGSGSWIDSFLSADTFQSNLEDMMQSYGMKG